MQKKTKDWSDVTLRQAQELIEIKEITDPGLLEIEVETLSVLLNIDPVEIENWTPETILSEFAKYSFLDKLPGERSDKTFKVLGKTYVQVPFNEYSVAQMVDIEEWVADGLIPNLHKILTRMYHPGKRNWKGKWIPGEYVRDEAIEEAFRDLPMDLVYGLSLFFYRIVTGYLHNLKDSLMETAKHQMMTMIQSSLEEEQLTK